MHSEHKAEIMSNFAHSLRYPINGVKAPLELCVNNPDIAFNIKLHYLYPAYNSLQLSESKLSDMVDYTELSNNDMILAIETKNIREYLYELPDIV